MRTPDKWVWVNGIHRFAVAHEPGPSHFTRCWLEMNTGHPITRDQAHELMCQRCPHGCFQTRPVPRYRDK